MKLSFVSALFLLSFSVAAYTPGKAYKVTILHTNDHHGAFWKNGEEEYGMAARATLIARLREEIRIQGGSVLLLDGGDVNTGTPESELADAEPDFRGMSLMGYDAMAVGNHEFDKPFPVLLKQREQWAKFPFLSANIYEKKTGKRFFEATKSLELDGLKIVLLGLTTEQTPQQSIRFPNERLEIRSPVEEAAKIVPSLRKDADILIAVTHMGHYPNEEHGSRAPGDVTLARRVKGFDVIVGGHTQLPLFKTDFQNGAHIVQAGEWGKHLGRVDLEFKDGKVTLLKYELIPVNLKAAKGPRIKEDESLLRMLRPFKEKTEALSNLLVGKLEGKFEGHRSVIRLKETNLGNFVTFLMTESTGADAAVTDSGVIRNSLEAGEVTFGEILSVHPPAFGLKFVTVDMSGAELRDYLSKVSVLTDGAYPQFHGIKVKLKDGKLADAQIRTRKSGTFAAIDAKARYTLALTDFIAGGGDGYPIVNKFRGYKESGIVDADAMRAYFEKKKTVRADDFAPIGNFEVLK